LGYGLSEKTYQKAVALAFSEKKIGFVEQLYAPVVFKEKIVAKNFFDFLIEDVLVLELKRGDKFSKAHIEQVFNYLKTKKLKLGILAYFGPSRLHFKRIVNIN
jgi:GxxExxY protein